MLALIIWFKWGSLFQHHIHQVCIDGQYKNIFLPVPLGTDMKTIQLKMDCSRIRSLEITWQKSSSEAPNFNSGVLYVF